MAGETEIHDIIVAGSGLTGAQVCQTLLEGGANILLLDAGIGQEDKFKGMYPDKDFVDIRKNSDDQRRLFLGDDFEGIPWGEMKTGAQLTPPRKYMVRGIDKWLKMLSDSFFPFESLAYGGLGNGWGAGCYVFSEAEFTKMGYQRSEFMDAYQAVASRIGVTQGTDGAIPYTSCELSDLLPPIDIEDSMNGILKKYKGKKQSLNKAGFYLGKPSLAITTKEVGDRKAFAYKDMEFWHDQDKSVYRPWITIDKLEEKPGFRKVFGKVILSFKEEEGIVHIGTKDITTGEVQVFKTKKLVMCTGVLSTARIVMRSFPTAERLPILCNPYMYVPMLNWRRLGSVPPARKSGMGQLVMFYDTLKDNSDVSMAAFFTYRSLMLFRLVKEAPLNFSDARALMQYLISGMVIAGMHHSEAFGENKYLELVPDSASLTGDAMKAVYHLSAEEQKAVDKKDKEFFKAFMKLGCIPIRKVNPGHGSSIHYAGTLPVSETEKPLSTAPDGLLYGTKNVFIADGSSFKFLPAKGISFTLMANAHRVAKKVLERGNQ